MPIKGPRRFSSTQDEVNRPRPVAVADEYSPELAHWLEESGRRHAKPPKESPEKLLKFLEELAGEKLESREDIARYFSKLKAREAEARDAGRKRRFVRQTILVVLLGIAIGQYYYWDVQAQIAASQRNYYFGPPDPAGPVKVVFRSQA